MELLEYADVLFSRRGIREELDVDTIKGEISPGTVNRIITNVPNANTDFLNAFIRHRHFLARVENRIARQTQAPLKSALNEVVKRLKDQSNNPLSDWSLNRLDRLNDQFTTLLGIGTSAAQEELRGALTDVIITEHKVLSRMHKDILTVNIPFDLSEPSIEEIDRMATAQLGGTRWSDRMVKNYGESVVAMRQSLAVSMALGEGSKTAARRLRKEITHVSVSRAETIARSEIMRVANDTAVRMYKRNPDVIKGVRAVETLDGRTCLICAGLDGKVFGVNEARRPVYPIHANCRGFLAPVTRSFKEMADAGIIDPKEMPPGFIKKYDGRVPSRSDYETWFKSQDSSFQKEILGPTRFKMFASGRMKVTAFAKDLKVLRLDELPMDAMGPLEKPKPIPGIGIDGKRVD